MKAAALAFADLFAAVLVTIVLAYPLAELGVPRLLAVALGAVAGVSFIEWLTRRPF